MQELFAPGTLSWFGSGFLFWLRVTICALALPPRATKVPWLPGDFRSLFLATLIFQQTNKSTLDSSWAARAMLEHRIIQRKSKSPLLAENVFRQLLDRLFSRHAKVPCRLEPSSLRDSADTCGMDALLNVQKYPRGDEDLLDWFYHDDLMKWKATCFESTLPSVKQWLRPVLSMLNGT